MNANNHWMVLLNPTDIVKNLPSLRQSIPVRCGLSMVNGKNHSKPSHLSKRALIIAEFDRGADIKTITEIVGTSWKYVINCLNNEGLRVRPLRKGSTKRRPVDQLALDGSYIATFPSISKAGKALGIEAACINNVCHERQRKAGGYRFRFHDAASNKQSNPQQQ